MKTFLIIGSTVLCGLVLLIADCSGGRDGPPTSGSVVGRHYTPPYTTITFQYIYDDKGNIASSIPVTTYYPETYTMFFQLPSGDSFHQSVNSWAYSTIHDGRAVTCQRRYGRWSSWSYGWRITDWNAPRLNVEKP